MKQQAGGGQEEKRRSIVEHRETPGQIHPSPPPSSILIPTPTLPLSPMSSDQSQLSLEANGLCVARTLVDPFTLAECYKAISDGFGRQNALSGPISQKTLPARLFLQVQTSPTAPMTDEPTHKRDFKLRYESIEPLLKSALARAAEEHQLLRSLGPDAELIEITAIRGLPGAAAQDWHADSSWR